MKKTFFSLLALAFLYTPALAASQTYKQEDDPLANIHKSLKDEAFVVETDEESGQESLNRIAGEIDLGFTAPDQEYKSPNQYKAGPFGQEEAKDKSPQRY